MRRRQSSLSAAVVADNHSRTAAFFLAYGLAVALFFLCLGFPFDLLERWTVFQIAQATSIWLQPHERRVDFPLRVQWGRVGIDGFKRADSRVLQGEQVTLDLAVLPLLRQAVSVNAQFRLLDGTVTGVAEWPMWRERAPNRLRGSVRDLDWARLIGGAIAGGRLRADWDYTWDDGGALTGSGVLNMELAGFTLPFGLSIGTSAPTVTFRKASGRMVVNRGVATVEEFKAEGEEVVAWGGGTVILQNPIGESPLDLTLRVRARNGIRLEQFGRFLNPEEASGNGRFVVKGTLRRPTLLLNDLPLSIATPAEFSGKAQ